MGPPNSPPRVGPANTSRRKVGGSGIGLSESRRAGITCPLSQMALQSKVGSERATALTLDTKSPVTGFPRSRAGSWAGKQVVGKHGVRTADDTGRMAMETSGDLPVTFISMVRPKPR